MLFRSGNTRPIVAAVEGDAFGAGLSIAMAADRVVAGLREWLGPRHALAKLAGMAAVAAVALWSVPSLAAEFPNAGFADIADRAMPAYVDITTTQQIAGQPQAPIGGGPVAANRRLALTWRLSLEFLNAPLILASGLRALCRTASMPSLIWPPTTMAMNSIKT